MYTIFVLKFLLVYIRIKAIFTTKLLSLKSLAAALLIKPYSRMDGASLDTRYTV